VNWQHRRIPVCSKIKFWVFYAKIQKNKKKKMKEIRWALTPHHNAVSMQSLEFRRFVEGEQLN